MQRLKRAVARRFYRAISAKAALPATNTVKRRPIEEVVALASWAPSGDNTQPWRMEIESDDCVTVTLRHAPENVYEYRRGQPTLLAGGMLLESLAIAASAWGLRASWQLDGPPDTLRLRVRCTQDCAVAFDPLCGVLTTRSVRREAFRMRRLTAHEKTMLSASLGADWQVDWHETTGARLALAGLGMRATDIRLRMRAAFDVHRRVVDWTNRESPTGIPSGALGLAGWTVAAMRWASRDWGRMQALNTLGGTLTAGVQMGFLASVAQRGTIHDPAGHRRARHARSWAWSRHCLRAGGCSDSG